MSDGRLTLAVGLCALGFFWIWSGRDQADYSGRLVGSDIGGLLLIGLGWCVTLGCFL